MFKNLDCCKLRLLQPVGTGGYWWVTVGTGGYWWVPVVPVGTSGYRWPLVESKYYIVTNLDCYKLIDFQLTENSRPKKRKLGGSTV